jgi:imidazolonepropionase
MIRADLVIYGARQLVTLADVTVPPGPRRGHDLAELSVIEQGALAARDGKIVWIGPADALPRQVSQLSGCGVFDATGHVVTPGLVDPHTHLVFARGRAVEFSQRAAGKSYSEIAQAGGGIARSVADLRAGAFDELCRNAGKIASRMLTYGTTTAEAKSGYGLDLEHELKMLRAIRTVDSSHAIDLVPTALPAHTIPVEYRSRPSDYVDLVCHEILPAVAREKLAVFNDVFVESGAFSLAWAERIQSAAASLGFGLRFHVDQLSPMKGTELAVRLGAISADHLDFISDDGIRCLADSTTIGVLIPGVSYFLDCTQRPPARRMIEAGVAVALATDCNPGSNMCESMTQTMNQACVLYRMSPEEALTAATVNAAWSLQRADRIGSLTVGKQCDCVIWDTDDYRDLSYHYGVNLAVHVIKNGMRAAP